MLAKKLAVLVGVGALAFGVNFAVAGDDCCGGKKGEAKKDDCCKGDDKGAAKKDDDCKDGCCGKKDGAAKDETAKKDGCGDKGCTDGSCAAVLESKNATYALKLEGKTTDDASGSIGSPDGNVAKFSVSHETGIATIDVTAGKTVKLSDVARALGDKFKLDESAKIAGIVRVEVSGATCGSCMKAVCSKLATLDIEKVGCSLEAEKTLCSISFAAKGGASPKAIKALFEGSKFTVAEIYLIGAQKAAAPEKTKS